MACNMLSPLISPLPTQSPIHPSTKPEREELVFQEKMDSHFSFKGADKLSKKKTASERFLHTIKSSLPAAEAAAQVFNPPRPREPSVYLHAPGGGGGGGMVDTAYKGSDDSQARFLARGTSEMVVRFAASVEKTPDALCEGCRDALETEARALLARVLLDSKGDLITAACLDEDSGCQVHVAVWTRETAKVLAWLRERRVRLVYVGVAPRSSRFSTVSEGSNRSFFICSKWTSTSYAGGLFRCYRGGDLEVNAAAKRSCWSRLKGIKERSFAKMGGRAWKMRLDEGTVEFEDEKPLLRGRELLNVFQ